MNILKMIKFISEICSAKKIISKIKYNAKPYAGKTVVFFTIRSTSYSLFKELFISYQLAELGFKIIVLLDDGILKHWDAVREKNNRALTHYKEKIIKMILLEQRKRIIIKCFSHVNIKIVYLSDILGKSHDESLNEISKNWHQHAESSTRKYFERGKVDFNNGKHLEYYNKSLFNCSVMASVAKVTKEIYKPDLVLSTHGIYSLWGPSFDYMKQSNIPSIIFGTHAYVDQSIIISDVIAQKLSEDSEWKKYETNHIVNDKERNLAVACFNSRINHTAPDTKIYYGSIQHFESKYIERGKNQKSYGLFPNIIWDGDVVERNTIYNNIVDWMLSTIKRFETSPHNLIIRIHPAEATLWKDSQSLEEIVKNEYPNISSLKNVHLISAGEKINTYEFIQNNIDIGIIYDGILLMEMPFLGIPVISCAKSRYSGAGFTYEPSSKKEYEDMLANPDIILNDFSLTKSDQRERLLKYSYWYFNLCRYYLPILAKNRILDISFKGLEIDDVDVYQNDKLKRTIDKITSYIR